VEVGVDALFAHPVLSDFVRGVENARHPGCLRFTRAERVGPAPFVVRPTAGCGFLAR